MLEGFLPTAYIYMNAFILAFGVWGIIAPDSVDSIFMVSVVKSRRVGGAGASAVIVNENFEK